MSSLLRRLRYDERGVSFVFVGVGFMAFLAATTLAIDVGMFMTARSQAQNSADAGALSGATALYYNDFNDRTASGPAVQSAINTARQGANQVMGSAASVTPPDVTFPNDPTGEPTRVRVNVFRTVGRANPVPTLIGQYFGVASVNITATATAEASRANAVTCVKPFMIPDRWNEQQSGPWDPDDTFEMYDNQNNPLANPDIYIPADQSGYTGYNPVRDLGIQLVIRAGTGNNISPTMYFSWKMAGDIGGDFYSDNIANCNQQIVHWGDLMIQEPGNMVGPTNQGIDELIAKDPSAYWDSSNNRVVSSQSPSPRVAPIPLYDPVYYAEGKANGRTADFKVANWIGFFIEGRNGNEVTGRIVPVGGIIDGGAPTPGGIFPRVIRLVE